MQDFWINVAASAFYSLILIGLTLISLKYKFMRDIAKKLGVKIHTDKPQLDFDIIIRDKRGKADLIVKNAGNRPAYNVYAFIFEGYEVSSGFHLRSLGQQKVRSGVLAVNEKLIFTDKQLAFIGCNVTSTQEVWIDYSDEDGDHYRTIVIPNSPRGDDMKVQPPIMIKYRIPLMPELDLESKDHYRTYRNGESKILNMNY